MSVEIVNNPNDIAATFDLGRDVINPYGKIIIPRNDAIAEHVPLAKHILSKHPAFRRVDLTQSDEGETVLTVNLITIVGEHPQNFWNDMKRNLVQSWINDFFFSNTPAVNLGALGRDYTPIDKFDIGDDADVDVSEIFNNTNKVLTDLAQNHGGGYEIIDLALLDSTGLDHQNVNVLVSVFGACAGCSSFAKTYGNAPDDINNTLSPDNPYRIYEVEESVEHKGGLIFNRAP